MAAQPEQAIIQLEREGLTLPDVARAIEVGSQEEYDCAVEFVASVDRSIGRVRAVLDPICEANHRAWKVATEARGKLLMPREEAKRIAKAKVGAFEEAQEAARRAEEARLALEARKRTEQARLAAAVEAEAAGMEKAEVDRFLAEPIAVAPVEAAPTYAKDNRVVRREVWHFELIDLWVLVKAAAKSKTLLAYLKLDEAELRKVVQAQKSLCDIPGIRVFPQTDVAFRRKEE